MATFVKKYVQGCLVCQTTKTLTNEKPVPLIPTEIPSRPWEVITADFVMDLPEVGERNTLLNVVGKFSKMAIFIPTTKEVMAEETGKLLIENIFQ